MKGPVQHLKHLIMGIGLLSGCYACEQCNVDEMPVISVQFLLQDTNTFTVRGALVNSMTVRSNDTLELPFSLTSDTVVYEFENESGEMQLLALSYERQTQFENSGCGFFLAIENVQTLPQTSFPKLQVYKNDYSTGWDIYIYD